MKWLLLLCCMDASAASSRNHVPLSDPQAETKARRSTAKSFDFRAAERKILENYSQSPAVAKMKTLLDAVLIQVPDGGLPLKAELSALAAAQQESQILHREKEQMVADKLRGKIINADRLKQIEDRFAHLRWVMEERDKNARQILAAAAARAGWKLIPPSENVFETKDKSQVWLMVGAQGELTLNYNDPQLKGPENQRWNDSRYFRVTGTSVFGQEFEEQRGRSILLLPSLKVNIFNTGQYELRTSALYRYDAKTGKARGMAGGIDLEELSSFLDGEAPPELKEGFGENSIRPEEWESLHQVPGLSP